MANAISNSDDMIDSRDVIARIEELTEERNYLAAHVADLEERRAILEAIEEPSLDEADELAMLPHSIEESQFDEDDATELAELEVLADGAEGYCEDWQHGATLIRDSYFEDYARDLADDLGLVQRDVGWPYTCIDWEQAASELRQDYTSVEFGGVTYWVR